MNITKIPLHRDSQGEIHPAELHIHFSADVGEVSILDQELDQKLLQEAFIWFIEAELEKLELMKDKKQQHGESDEQY